MKRIIGLLLLAIVCGSGVTIEAQNYNAILKAGKPKTDANGYYSLLDLKAELMFLYRISLGVQAHAWCDKTRTIDSATFFVLCNTTKIANGQNG